MEGLLAGVVGFALSEASIVGWVATARRGFGYHSGVATIFVVGRQYIPPIPR